MNKHSKDHREQDVLRLAALRQSLVDAARLAAHDPQLSELLRRALAQHEAFAAVRLSIAVGAVRN